MTEQEKSSAVLKAEENLRQAKARLAKAKREERRALEKKKSHHKFIMALKNSKNNPINIVQRQIQSRHKEVEDMYYVNYICN